jgi:UDP-glucose 4-epimerase
MKNIIVVTGGSGFIGSNLIKYLLLKTKNKIISIDNYSSGSVNNQAKDKRVKYINSDTNNIAKKLDKFKKNKSPFSFWRVCENSPKFYKYERLFFF